MLMPGLSRLLLTTVLHCQADLPSADVVELALALPVQEVGALALDPSLGGSRDEAPPPVVAEAEEQDEEVLAEPDPARELLERVSHNADGLTGFTASVSWVKEDALVMRREIRKGTLLYQVAAETGRRRFAALFDLYVSGRIGSDRTTGERKLQHLIFDGRWFVEVDHDRKQFIKREIVPPGETFDPLKLGEGPLPIPIGQPVDEVLRRFEVGLVELPTEGTLRTLERVDGLRLTPRAGTEMAQEYAHIDLFFDRQTLLPVGVIAAEAPNEFGDADRTLLKLTDLVRNPAFTDAQLEQLDVTEPDATEWNIVVEPWRD